MPLNHKNTKLYKKLNINPKAFSELLCFGVLVALKGFSNRTKRWGIHVFLFFLLIFSSLYLTEIKAQPSGSTRALKSFQKGMEAFQEGKWGVCEKEMLKTIAADSTYADAHIMLGDVYLETRRPVQAVESYRKALRFNPDRAYIVNSLLANTLFGLERYHEACAAYETVLSDPVAPAGLKTAIEKKYLICETRKSLLENPVDFQPRNLGAGVNTMADEFVNALGAEGDVLYFTRKAKTVNDRRKAFYETFYTSTWTGSEWDVSTTLGYPPGTEEDAGGLCISPDGRMIFFTACFRSDSYGSCDLYYSEKQGNKWSPARNMGAHINSDQWDAQPSISPDGNTLYFTSTRKGGHGGADIWKTVRTQKGEWSKPVNLGPDVNTPESEMAPFIHFDNMTLYFSSAGHPGMGGMDLFMSRRSGEQWSQPMNLGYPLNSSSDDVILIVNPTGDKGYISRENIEGAGGFDIFEFDLFPIIMPVPVTYLKGRVLDKDTRKPLGAMFELIDISIDSLIISASSDEENGEFLVCLPVNRNYALNVSRSSYLFYSDHFPLENLKSQADPQIMDILLTPVKVGGKLILRNVFYDTDKYQLNTASYTELDILVQFLSDNPKVEIEISGHTDNEGSEAYNLELSEKRARTVYEYLISKGINSSRLVYKGFGESQPVSTNETPEGRASNRRTEIKILRAG